MDLEKITCYACLSEFQEEAEMVSLNSMHDEENGMTYGDCLIFCANMANLGDISRNIENSIVCHDCSIELEISYRFLRKLMFSQNIFSPGFDMLEEKSEENAGSYIERSAEENSEEYITEYVEETHELITEEIQGTVDESQEQEKFTEMQQNLNSDEQEIMKLMATETEVEEQDKTPIEEEINVNDTETVPFGIEGSNDDDLIEEIAYEEIEVYTNSPEMEIVPTEYPNEPPRRRFGKFNCDYCGKLFPNYSRMSAHRRCHEKPRTTFNCIECGRMYATDQALSVHVRTAHNKEGFTCSVCSKVFLVERSLEIHMRYHTKTLSYDCKDCGKNFAQKGHLNTHQNVKHNGLRFICVFPNCNKLFTSSASLRDHEFSHNLSVNIAKADTHRKQNLKYTHVKYTT